MREILFRGKCTNSGEWVEGDLFQYESGETAIHSGFSRLGYEANEIVGRNEVIPSTVGEYTGLTDRNGRKIFEGDIIEVVDTFNETIRGVVYWCNGAFWADCTTPDGNESFHGIGYLPVECAHIIGNIYDNPELLEGGNENG